MKTLAELQPLLFPGEVGYAIYSVFVYWVQNITPAQKTPLPPKWTEGLPEGRFRNHTCFDLMFQEERPIEEIKDEVMRDRYAGLIERELPHEPSDPEVRIEFKGWETWCLQWFQHWTHDVGLSDADVLRSFENYVRRIEEANDRERTYDESGFPKEPYCLMGAEDRWRWSGLADGKNPSGERTPPPCRCEFCKKHKVVRIAH